MVDGSRKPLDRERLSFILLISTCLLASTSALVTAWVAFGIARRLPAPADVAECGCSTASDVASPKVPGSAQQDGDDGPGEASDDDGAVGQSVGTPRAGALFGGKRLEPGPGYLVRNEKTSYGTVSTIAHLQHVVSLVHREQPRLHDLVVGDLSSELGGRLLGHFSHQSGRDVDLGFFYRRRPEGYPERFVEARRDNLNFKATFSLIQALAATASEPGGVEWILLDYEIQRMIYAWAKRQRVSDDELGRIFQYPHGPTADRGLVRHFPQHRNHLHVRFSCGTEDRHCTSPEGPPGPESPMYRAMLEDEAEVSSGSEDAALRVGEDDGALLSRRPKRARHARDPDPGSASASP